MGLSRVQNRAVPKLTRYILKHENLQTCRQIGAGMIKNDPEVSGIRNKDIRVSFGAKIALGLPVFSFQKKYNLGQVFDAAVKYQSLHKPVYKESNILHEILHGVPPEWFLWAITFTGSGAITLAISAFAHTSIFTHPEVWLNGDRWSLYFLAGATSLLAGALPSAYALTDYYVCKHNDISGKAFQSYLVG